MTGNTQANRGRAAHAADGRRGGDADPLAGVRVGVGDPLGHRQPSKPGRSNDEVMAGAADALFGGDDVLDLELTRAFSPDVERELANGGLDVAGREAMRGEIRQAIVESQAPPIGVGRVLARQVLVARRAQQPGARPRAETDAALEDAIARGAETIRASIFGVYGLERGEEYLRRASAFVRAHPALARIVGKYELGDDGPLIEALVHHVHRTNWRPATAGRATGGPR